MKSTYSKELLSFIKNSKSCFHAIENIKKMLTDANFCELFEGDKWALTRSGKYFTVRNDSSIIAFEIPKNAPSAFIMAAAHSDSPSFKIKENPEIASGAYVKLNTEKYGGMLMSTWLDRPLSVAGRVVVKNGNAFETKLIDIDRDLLIIPNVAIHMNRAANDGMAYKANIDTIPLFGDSNANGRFMPLVAKSAGVKEKDILGHDLFLYCRDSGTIVGYDKEYIASPKLDDLECAFALVKGIINSEKSDAIKVCAVFDNEEVGSETKQGAASSYLRDTLRRITLALNISEEDYQRILSKSFLVSADNAHAIHPNHPEYADAGNAPVMNGGIVIKYNANQRYSTDALSAAIFKSVCDKASVKYQSFANRSDMLGGSTLGSISNTMVPVKTVDIGLAQLAMHSAYETAGVRDLDDLVDAMTVYFEENSI
ncbi:MAG: M18 family aminopeptidase [Ruminococcaceae bacterium]|nr:M18 family aminopeptidase [Oscillospiraceae bacterium]